jgi:ATP-dependent protease ClpP protease subunit
VFVCGEIDERLVHRLTPAICKLRGEGSQPITAYIDSRGGSTLSTEHLRALLKAPNPDGAVCRLITVATTRAASAAADLLALGDYAVAYPQALIHCHGTRLSAEEVTKETAESLAMSLQEANEDFALRLAKRVFARMAFHYTRLRSEFPDIRKRAAKEKWERPMKSDLECFALAIYIRLSSHLQKLPEEVFFLYESLLKMRDFVLKRLGKIPEGQELAVTEASMLKHLLDFELSEEKPKYWSFSSGGIDHFASDFRELADFLFGRHHEALEDHIQSFGVLFLNPDQIALLEKKRAANAPDTEEWMKSVVRPVIEPLWYFVVALCRLLQQGENRLTAVDAYWLGLVDEVVGARLPSLRLIAENPDV